ncbi:MAG TPA: hypothetical protein VLH09_04150 [Bryobacteraceae bacterium]|nr:hypothetical protein [Bryobacteraceae bacterium]
MAQVLQAGDRQLISLELDPELIAKIARQVGYACEVTDGKRGVLAELCVEGREAPLLLFDAAEPANLGWFSRCQFYVDGHTGAVLQTPMYMANQKDSSGRPLPNSIRLQISKEIPISYKVAGRQQVNEQVIYSVLASLLAALLETGVAICGGSLVRPLAGRIKDLAGRN